MPGSNPQNTKIFHAASIGRANYLLLAPAAPAANVGCALVYDSLSSNKQALGFTGSPVMLRPANLPTNPSLAVINSAGTVSYVEVSSLDNATGLATAVRFSVQTLSSPQKTQARTNIGLVPQTGWSDPVDYVPTKALDADSIYLQELYHYVATLAAALKAANIISS